MAPIHTLDHWLNDRDDALGDAVLHVEDVFEGTIEVLRPKVGRGRRVDQLGCDPQPVSGTNDELREVTAKVLNRLSAVMRSSTMPSAR